MTSAPKVPRVIVAGIGGFAASHHTSLRDLENEGLCKVVATCDPSLGRLNAEVENFQFAERGVAVYSEYSEMMGDFADAADVACIATPIPCHEPMHRDCVRAGIACYLEKPPTLDPEALERMIAVDADAETKTHVGFNYVIEKRRFRLKKRLLNQEFGPLKSVSFQGQWSRKASYYTRNNWAGRLIAGDDLILDSCFANAMAHHVQNSFFWAGTDAVQAYASPLAVTAELYRAYPIESMDSVFAKFQTREGIEIRVASTHACAESRISIERLVCENAVLEITATHIAVTEPDGNRTVEESSPRILLEVNLREYLAYSAGERERPVVLLEETRPFVHANALLLLAADAIQQIPGKYVERQLDEDKSEERLVITGITKAAETLITSGQLPSETDCPWASEPGVAEIADLGDLRRHVGNLIHR